MSLKRLLLCSSLLLLTSCKQPAQTIVVAGDSWAAFTCFFKSLETALTKVGLTDVAANSTCAVTTRFGIRAENWLTSAHHKATLLALKDKSVKVLYLSLGGNDVLNLWNKTMTSAEEQAIFDIVTADMLAAINQYRSLRPDIKILISGYDYPRFFADHPIKEYVEAYEDMGSPTPAELNTAVLRFSDRVAQLADQKTVFYIHHYGLMHYYLGNPEVGLDPFKTLAPALISAPQAVTQFGGNPNLQSAKDAMYEIKISDEPIIDAFHLNRFGYEKLAEHSVQHYLRDWLKAKQ